LFPVARGRVLLKACGDQLLSHVVPLEIDWHENKPWRNCDLSVGQALEFPCLRRGVVHLIDTNLSYAMGIPESERVESGAKDDDLLNPSFDDLDKASSAIRLRAVVNRRPMLAKGCWFANRSTSFSSSRRIFMANGS